ncbi:diguanylate cyclase (GGDEF) domain-containing protein [Desulfosporosinus acidiphilus SJ4]|uniref:Diguanylate cyclase (GGDEF) domain-containing protein n=1 Tax=Desulfosporosinus acidiphilus (strain DSM 22704 / JCM 16185 / SJ4) TaxID=646529 RepID=I4DC40_DESAJ|nr:diguanylate cyclase [Desulfosporosinus acidiphilus]AFM43364.1 diguanylate cyclase (GGDEF) domain-containing protein [Desulfosporosinus acidiphilus SJ4]
MTEIGKVLRKRYIIGLSLIAFLVLLGQCVIQYTIQQESGYSMVINIAGRQRMLSQRITKCALGYELDHNASDRTHYLEELKESVDEWESSRDKLLYGDQVTGLSGQNSAAIISLYAKLDPYYQKILTAAQDIIVGGNTKEPLSDNNLATIQANEESFLKVMDAIVFQYTTEANNKISVIRTTGVALMLLTFIVLMLEVRFIFRPAERIIDDSFNSISDNNENIEKLFELAPAALFLMRLPDLKVLRMNSLAEQFTGTSFESNESDSLLKYLEENLENDSNLVEKMVEGIAFADEEAVFKTEDSVKAVLVSASTFHYENNPAMILSMMDISRRKNAEEILKKYASTDELTGLLNRRSGKIILDNAIERAKAENTDLAVSFCDIDGLKYVNDTFGHEEGDWYIIAIAEAITSNLRKGDFAFRYGGDELILIFNNCDEEKSRIIVKRINNSIERKKIEFEKPYNMSLSIGTVHLLSKDNTSADDLIAEADNLMYEEKKRKKVQRLM